MKTALGEGLRSRLPGLTLELHIGEVASLTEQWRFGPFEILLGQDTPVAELR